MSQFKKQHQQRKCITRSFLIQFCNQPNNWVVFWVAERNLFLCAIFSHPPHPHHPLHLLHLNWNFFSVQWKVCIRQVFEFRIFGTISQQTRFFFFRVAGKQRKKANDADWKMILADLVKNCHFRRISSVWGKRFSTYFVLLGCLPIFCRLVELLKTLNLDKVISR